MRKLKGFVSLTRPYVLFTTTSFYIASALLSINSIPAAYPFFIGFLSTVFAIASAHTLNDYFDRKNDQNNPRTANRPIPSGNIPHQQALVVGFIYGVIAVLLTFLLNPPSIVLAFIAIPLPFIYQFMRKRQIPFSFLCTMAAVFFIILLGSAAVSGQYWSQNILLFVIFGISWEMGRTLISEVQDVDHDKVTDITTISTTISSKRAARLIFILFLISAIASILIGLLGQLGILFLIIASAAAIWLTYRTFELVKTPTTANAIKMLFRAPKYLVLICLILIVSIILNTLFPI
jgi:4-hydroxybenzoate polyprenyltransferase